MFNREGLLTPRATPKLEDHPLKLSATVYSIYSQLPSIKEVVPLSATWGRAMLWWQRPTTHGSNITTTVKTLLLSSSSSPSSVQALVLFSLHVNKCRWIIIVINIIFLLQLPLFSHYCSHMFCFALFCFGNLTTRHPVHSDLKFSGRWIYFFQTLIKIMFTMKMVALWLYSLLIL